ncbi:MAG: hypothetical protein LBT09_08305 [Planctomycetaceae bacterium]|nr:hypothetical protein [Planctomycetaceae bacterium]
MYSIFFWNLMKRWFRSVVKAFWYAKFRTRDGIVPFLLQRITKSQYATSSVFFA